MLESFHHTNVFIVVLLQNPPTPCRVYLPHIINNVIYHIVVSYGVNSGPEFAGCPDEDGELYEDCTLTE